MADSYAPATLATGTPVLEVRHVSRRYGEVNALDDVSLVIGKGEFMTLLGASGSGKTTLLRIIAGADHPSSGQLMLNGRDVTDTPARDRGMGMVFQSYALIPHLSVFDNVAFPLQIRGRPKAEIRQRVEEALELVRLSRFRDRKPRQLSGGQQQRVAIARCLVYRPALVLMDEPLGALDKNLREQMQMEIKNLHKQFGLSVLYVTHDQEEALAMSDRICIMREGRIDEMDTPRQLYLAPKRRFTAEFFGFANVFTAPRHPTASNALAWGTAGAVRTALDLPGDAELCWMVRPERIRVLAERESESNEATGTLVDATLAGTVTRFRLQLDDGMFLTFSGLTTADRAPQPGDRLRVGWRADAVILLDAR